MNSVSPVYKVRTVRRVQMPCIFTGGGMVVEANYSNWTGNEHRGRDEVGAYTLLELKGVVSSARNRGESRLLRKYFRAW